MAYFVAQESDGCHSCPFLLAGDTPSKKNALCLKSNPYPFDFIEKSLNIVVPVESEKDLPTAASLFTQQVFTAMGRSGIRAHPRALLRSVWNGRRQPICPESWPMPSWVQMMIEQVTFDTAGMTPRLLYNDKPWLAQPALYTQVYSIVVSVKATVKEWSDQNKQQDK